jgi:Ran GTPase-activating protein (RanGAP) involved in mRNA processing and transport
MKTFKTASGNNSTMLSASWDPNSNNNNSDGLLNIGAVARRHSVAIHSSTHNNTITMLPSEVRRKTKSSMGNNHPISFNNKQHQQQQQQQNEDMTIVDNGVYEEERDIRYNENFTNDYQSPGEDEYDDEYNNNYTDEIIAGDMEYMEDDIRNERLLDNSEDNKVSMTMQDIRKLYNAKCEDQKLSVIPKREERFVELIHKSCTGLIFSMKEHGLGRQSGAAISQVLANNKFYSILELCGNRFRDEGTIELAKLFETNDTIVRLDLRSNDIGGKGGQALFERLKRNETLTSLDLSGLSGINRNHIGLKGSRALCEMLQMNKVLCQLNLASNGMGSEGIRLLCQGLKGNRVITELNISSNNVGPVGCEYLSKVLKECNIIRLEMERNQISDRGASILANALKVHPSPTLEYWDLCENRITLDGIREICEMLKNDKKMSVLKLDYNEFSNPGAEQIEMMLEVNKSLKALHIARNVIEDEGAKSIGKSLRSNDTLTKIDLSHNYIEDEGAKIFSNSLKHNATLTSLDLSHNRIGDKGGITLAEVLRHNSTLQFLSIKENDMKVAGEHFAEALRYNTTLMMLDFAFNNFNYKSYIGITDGLKRNMKTFKAETTTRLQKQIERLQLNEYILLDVNAEIEKEIHLHQQAEEAYKLAKANIERLRIQIGEDTERLKQTLENKKLERHQAEIESDRRLEELAADLSSKVQNQRKMEQRIESERDKASKLKKQITNKKEEIDLEKQKAFEQQRPFMLQLDEEQRKLAVLKEKVKADRSDLYLLKKKMKELESVAGGKSEFNTSISPVDGSPGSPLKNGTKSPSNSRNRRSTVAGPRARSGTIRRSMSD